jgi:Family of unknown function (DUF5677)
MPKPSPQEILAIIEKLEHFLDDSGYIASTSYQGSKVLLALLSKILTTGRAVCILVNAGFGCEAFGLSRTMLEIFLTVRYISNDKTEERAAEYADYVAKATEHVLNVAAKRCPDKALPKLDRKFTEMAKKYRSPHTWSSQGGHVKTMAMEPDAYEVDASGNPIKQDFDYEHIYSQTSHYVHATIISLMGHGVNAGERFRVRANVVQDADKRNQALFNVLVFISKSFICAFRGLHDEQPADILEETRVMMTSFR